MTVPSTRMKASGGVTRKESESPVFIDGPSPSAGRDRSGAGSGALSGAREDEPEEPGAGRVEEGGSGGVRRGVSGDGAGADAGAVRGGSGFGALDAPPVSGRGPPAPGGWLRIWIGCPTTTGTSTGFVSAGEVRGAGAGVAGGAAEGAGLAAGAAGGAGGVAVPAAAPGAAPFPWATVSADGADIVSPPPRSFW